MKHFFIFFMALLFFVACSTKREYYQPTKIESTILQTKNIQGKIIDFNNNVAQLNNNAFINDFGEVINFKLNKNYQIVNIYQNEILTADDNGNFKILDMKNNELFSYKFSESVVAANVDGDDIALVLASNTLVYANKNLGVKMIQNLGNSYAQDSRFANPQFLNTIIIYPMLNGKLAVVNKSTLKIIREIVVSNEEFFNNVICLDIKDDRMIAATGKKVIVVTPKRTLHFNEDIKEVTIGNKEIFILTKDGTPYMEITFE